MPALRRSHDRHRGVRARLRAEVATNTRQDRHLMSQTASARYGLLVSKRWLRPGGDRSRPDGVIYAPFAR
jgi:hypothetical protein